MKKMLFMVNPVSGVKSIGSAMIPILDMFTKAGFEVTTHISQSTEDVEDVFLHHSSEYDIMVCSGGDGTLNRSVDALIRSGNHTDFAYIPAGTVNDFATTHQIPKKAQEAAELVIHGTPKPCDIGQFGNESFVYVAAFGTLSQVSYATPQKFKNVFGKLAYILYGTVKFFTMKSYHAVISDGEDTWEGDFISGIFSSSISVGGFQLPILYNADMSDGQMEIMLVRKPKNPLQAMKIVIRLLSKEKESPYVIFKKTPRVHFSSEEEVPFTVDGEFGGNVTDIDISMVQGAINMIV